MGDRGGSTDLPRAHHLAISLSSAKALSRLPCRLLDVAAAFVALGVVADAKALPVVVGVLAALPQRNDVIQLEGSGCAWRDVDQFAAAGAVRTNSQPDPQPGLLPGSPSGSASGTQARRLQQLSRVGHLNPQR